MSVNFTISSGSWMIIVVQMRWLNWTMINRTLSAYQVKSLPANVGPGSLHCEK
jgi:hypothetical protein